MRPAYSVPGLRKLKRTFVYSRQDAGSLAVKDEVEFAEARQVGTAIVTLSAGERLGPNKLRIHQSGETIEVGIETEGSTFTIKPEPIKGDLRTKKTPIRLGINLDQAVTQATVTITVRPTAGSSGS
jgi:hypothetical protein